jgi:hypothetical protein
MEQKGSSKVMAESKNKNNNNTESISSGRVTNPPANTIITPANWPT